ncbi:MAG: helix-turn-helix domain-containing protein [Pseudomonadales bacterium]|nr:helix-turn-helix domain-containing protein [Pseudomonadales bacterium]
MNMVSTIARADSRTRCNACTARHQCLFAGVETQHAESFNEAREAVRLLHKRDALFESGDEFDAIYVVRSGTLKTTYTNEDGVEHITGFHLPGNIIGLDGFADKRYTTTAVALETSSVCEYRFEDLIALSTRSPGLQARLWHQVSREISNREKLALALGHSHADARVAGFLLDTASRYRKIGYSGNTFRLPMTRQDIACHLGLTVETVCRVLTRFQETGLITREQREIKLVDTDTLESLSLGHKVDETARTGKRVQRSTNFSYGNAKVAA